MRICLVDDDNTTLQYLHSIVCRWGANRNISTDVSFHHSAEEFLFENNESYPFDVIILDIQMGKMNGLELAKIIRKVDDRVIIAFVSGMADFVYDGYEVQAIRYILKPINDDKIFELFDSALSNTKKINHHFILSISGEKHKIYHDDIIYIESMGHYVVFHMKSNNIDYKYSISTLTEEFAPYDFIRTHRSFIVNMKHVESINKTECLMINNIHVPLSRSEYKSVNEKFISYHLRGALK